MNVQWAVILALLCILAGCGGSSGSSVATEPNLQPHQSILFVVNSAANVGADSATEVPGLTPDVLGFNDPSAVTPNSTPSPQGVDNLTPGQDVPIALTADPATDTGYLTDDKVSGGQVLIFQHLSKLPGIPTDRPGAAISGFTLPRGIGFNSANGGTLYVVESGNGGGIYQFTNLHGKPPSSVQDGEFHSLSDLVNSGSNLVKGSFVTTAPELLTTAAGDLDQIGSGLPLPKNKLSKNLLFVTLTSPGSAGTQGFAVIDTTNWTAIVVQAPTDNTFGIVSGIAYDSNDDQLFVAQQGATSGRILIYHHASQLNSRSQPDTTLSLDGNPSSLSFDALNRRLYASVSIVNMDGTVSSKIEIFDVGSDATTLSLQDSFAVGGLNRGADTVTAYIIDTGIF